MQTVKSFWSSLFEIDEIKTRYLVLIFAVYLILLAVAVSRHEPWMDEAQAWLLVSDLSITDLFLKYLRYEGHPGLWYLILSVPAKLGLPYFTLNVLSAFFAAIGTWLFLRYSPFPLVVKILFPFSYFAFFQYGVVARSYCLIAPILFSIAIKYKTKIERPFPYIFLLSLLANISVHTFLMAGMFLCVHLLDVLKVWRQMSPRLKIQQGIAVFLFGLISLQLVLLLSPPPDQTLAWYTNFGLMNFFNVSRRMVSGALVLDESSKSNWLQFGVSLLIFVSTAFWFRRTRSMLLYLLPLFAIIVLLAVKYSNLWQQGILFFLWVFVLWISFDRNKNENLSKLGKIVLAIMTVVLGIQVYWSTYAIHNDFYHNYSGSLQVAEYIKTNQLENQKIFASGWKSIAILPYFNDNIFYNYNNGSNLRFWFWSNQNPTELGVNSSIISKIEQEQPSAVVFASDHLTVPENPEIVGYEFVGFFEGNLYWKTGIYEQNSYWIYRKKE